MEKEIILQKANTTSAEEVLFLVTKRGSIDSEKEVLERIERYSKDPQHLLMLGVIGEKPIGYIWIQNYGPHLRDGKSTARLHDIFVLENFRGLGVATKLFEYGRQWCKESDVSYFQWQANQDAVAFYKKLGLEGDTQSDLREHPFYEIQLD